MTPRLPGPRAVSAVRVFLGLDLGTSSVKTVALDAHGRRIASAAASYPTVSPWPGWAEQHPRDWSHAARSALGELASRLPPRARPAALGLSGQLPTLALIDDDRATRPAIVWYDGRAERQAAAMLEEIGAREWYRRSGVVLDAHYIAPMYAWLAEHEAATLVPGHRVGGAKDALLHALTGVWVTDPSTASGYGVYDPRAGSWDRTLCAAAGLDVERLPPVAPPWSIAGSLRDSYASRLPRDLPVAVGAADSLAGVLGCGGAMPETLCAIAGTSTAMILSSPTPRLDEQGRFLLTPHALPALWGLEMDLMSTGSALLWLAEMLGLPGPGDVEALAARSVPGARGLVVLPYLAGGEQGALWDAGAPAALAGLTLSHQAPDLARALLEGIAFEMRRCLLAWEGAGAPVGEIVLAGAARGDAWTHLVAAALERPVRRTAVVDASAHGAALLAGLAVGEWDAVTAQKLGHATLRRPIAAPAPEVARYTELYERYEVVSRQLSAGSR